MSWQGCQSAFQSAPRSRDRGDTWAAEAMEWETVFQSAPRSRDRGDHKVFSPLCLSLSFNPRPGHATGATTAIDSVEGVMQVSIRAPVTRPGRLRSSRTRRASGRVSIRAPVTRPGRHYRKRLFSSCAVVSIRAPVTRPGRRKHRALWFGKNLFQSAPRSRDRGDTFSK